MIGVGGGGWGGRLLVCEGSDGQVFVTSNYKNLIPMMNEMVCIYSHKLHQRRAATRN